MEIYRICLWHKSKFQPMCHDMGSACYDCHEFGTIIVIPNKKLYRNDKQHIVFARFSYHLFGITFGTSLPILIWELVKKT